MSIPPKAARQFQAVLEKASPEVIRKLRVAIENGDPTLTKGRTYDYDEKGEACAYCPIAFIGKETGCRVGGPTIRILVLSAPDFTLWLDGSGDEVWDQLHDFLIQYQQRKEKVS